MTQTRTTVDLTTGRCTCGCGQPVTQRFKQGHDAKLKGLLRRAHEQGHDVTVRLAKERRTTSAAEAAALLDSGRFSWSEWLTGGKR